MWSVTAAFADPAWNTAHDASDDVAILHVAPTVVNGVTRTLQDVTGANPLGDTPDPSTLVTVQGFNTGTDDQAVTCTTQLATTSGDPTLRCGNYRGGSSGSPWLVTGSDGVTRVTGVIGGLNQGGCTSQASYSSPFGTQVRDLLEHVSQT